MKGSIRDILIWVQRYIITCKIPNILLPFICSHIVELLTLIIYKSLFVRSIIRFFNVDIAMK